MSRLLTDLTRFYQAELLLNQWKTTICRYAAEGIKAACDCSYKDVKENSVLEVEGTK